MTDAERLALLNQTIDVLPAILAGGGQKPTLRDFAERTRDRLTAAHPGLSAAEVELKVEAAIEAEFPDDPQEALNAVLRLELID